MKSNESTNTDNGVANGTENNTGNETNNGTDNSSNNNTDDSPPGNETDKLCSREPTGPNQPTYDLPHGPPIDVFRRRTKHHSG